jgi:myosin heavy subunit
LQLSGLVVKQGEKLRVYNRIYRKVFNQAWIERALGNLRPYSEAFRAWVASGEQDESRLLRGGALEEAQAWAKGKNLSYLDQQFLAACEKKEIEQQIAVADKEAQLERERKDREAAEARNQALAEANRRVKSRIQIGAVVLIIAIFGAVISGVLAGNKVIEANSKVEDAKSKVAEANQRATDAEKREQKAQTNEKSMQKKAGEAAQKIKESQKELTVANKQLESSRQESKKLAEQAQQATKATKVAQEMFNEAQQRVDAAQQDVQKLNREGQKKTGELRLAENKLELAKKQQQEAQVKLDYAMQGEKEAREKRVEVETEGKKVEALIKNVSQLSQLGAKLKNKGLSSEANEAWSQAGRIIDMKDSPLKDAMLFASIYCAYQQLEQPNGAEQALNKSLDILNRVPLQVAVDNPEHWSAYFYVMRAKGKFFKEHNKTEAALKAYDEALNVLKEVRSKIPEKDFFSKTYLIISPNIIADLYRGDISLLSKVSQDYSKVQEALKEYLLAELKFFLESGNWKEADETTRWLMLYRTPEEKKKDKDVLDSEDFKTFPCDDLRTIDDLWVTYSKGYFGFSVQKRIWLSRDVNKDLGRFVQQVGWGQLENNGASFYYWLMDGVPFDLSAPTGRLPWAPTYYGGDNETRGNYMSRLIECLPNP